MNSDERICSIALTLCPGIGHIGAKRLIEGMGSAAEVFSRRKELPEIMPGVNPGVVTALDCPAAFLRAEQEMEFVEKNRLSCQPRAWLYKRAPSPVQPAGGRGDRSAPGRSGNKFVNKS